LIGQYAHGNEPSHHIAYMYTALGQPWKAADRIREIMATMYSATPAGLSGNEDCGQMSAWYVWSALGMYPMNPSSGEYVFGSPLMDEAAIYLPDNKVFRMVVKNNTGNNKYIQKVKWNGQDYAPVFLRHADLMRGGTLEIEMGPKPSATYGVNPETWPTSMSR
jgi:predicted alpha-1,2-mannosidase